ncbi:hypothetical protein JXI42_01935 [bacterium]|nr:hypothetical protein [bacterium]
MNIRTIIIILSILLLCFTFFNGCKEERVNPEGAAEKAKSSGEAVERDTADHPPRQITIDHVREQFPGVIGGAVERTGKFYGYRATDYGCPQPPPIAENVWTLADSLVCWYIVGPIPGGLNPENPQEQRITVKGVLKLYNNVTLYIDAR